MYYTAWLTKSVVGEVGALFFYIRFGCRKYRDSSVKKYRNVSWHWSLIKGSYSTTQFLGVRLKCGHKYDVCSFTVVNNPTYPYSCTFGTAILAFCTFL